MRTSKARAEQRLGKKLYTASDAAEKIGVSRQCLWRLVKLGKFKPTVNQPKNKIVYYSDADIAAVITYFRVKGGPRHLYRRPIAGAAPKPGVPEEVKPALEILAHMLAEAVVAEMENKRRGHDDEA